MILLILLSRLSFRCCNFTELTLCTQDTLLNSDKNSSSNTLLYNLYCAGICYCVPWCVTVHCSQ